MGMAAISYDPVATLADFSRRRGITFPLLSDAGSETIKRYGLLNTTIDPKNELYGYPFPGTFLVDPRGTERMLREKAPTVKRESPMKAGATAPSLNGHRTAAATARPGGRPSRSNGSAERRGCPRAPGELR